MSTTSYVELERVHGHYRGRLPGFSLSFTFTGHFCQRLNERWGRDVAEVLVSLHDGQVLAWDGDMHYVVELTHGLLGQARMLVVAAYPDRSDPRSVALLTVYPEWNGHASGQHVGVILSHDMMLTSRRPVLEVLEERMAA